MPVQIDSLASQNGSASNGHVAASNGHDHDGAESLASLSVRDDADFESGSGTAATMGNGQASTSAKTLDALDYQDDEKGFKPLWPGSEIDRRELVRLALQTFKEMGYDRTVATLEAETGFRLESQDVTAFRHGVLNGQWSLVEKLVQVLPQDSISDVNVVRFLIRQQRFLEALEAKETKKALAILRSDLAPLNHDANRLHLLSSLIMCPNAEELRKRADWDGSTGDSRRKLLLDIQRFVSPGLLVPERRLETLLEQAKSFQRQQCVFHSDNKSMTLLSDCNCDPSSLPSHTTNVLRDHTDEIWRLAFSNDGHYLATAGRDKTAIIWSVRDNFALDKIFRDHDDFVSCLSWSPDDSILLTAAESTIKMWNTSTGACIATLREHKYPIGAVSWLPDGKGFVSGGMDHRVYFWDLEGNVTYMLAGATSRVIDLAVTPDGKKLVVVGRADPSQPAAPTRTPNASRGATPANPSGLIRHEKRLSVYSLPGRKLEYEINQPGELTSICISRDSRFAIASHAPNEILYIDLRNGTIIRRFQGHDHGQFILHSCLGGELENYVISGSEDGQIYIWHRDTGVLVDVLSGHGPGSVNAVAWNWKYPGMLASASDDRTVRIWRRPGGHHHHDEQQPGATAE